LLLKSKINTFSALAQFLGKKSIWSVNYHNQANHKGFTSENFGPSQPVAHIEYTKPEKAKTLKQRQSME